MDFIGSYSMELGFQLEEKKNIRKCNILVIYMQKTWMNKVDISALSNRFYEEKFGIQFERSAFYHHWF